MPALPDVVCSAWENREGAIVLSTISQDGIPNSIYATCISKYDDETIIVADNYFNKTRANILAGSKAVILFITPAKKSYQIKGSLAYYTEGKYFENMKEWNPKRHPGNAAVVLTVEQVFSGAQQML